MAHKPNAHFLEELYDLSVANALLIDEETGLELYTASLETHTINQTAESELVKAGQNNDTFLEIKKDKEITIELVDIQQKRDWEALKLGGTLETKMVKVSAFPRNYTVSGETGKEIELEQTPVDGTPIVYDKKTKKPLATDAVTLSGKKLTITDESIEKGDVVFVGSYMYETEAEAIDIQNRSNTSTMRLELDIPKYGADNQVKYTKKVVFYRVSLGEDFSMEGSSERSKQTTTHKMTVLKHPDRDSLGFFAYIPYTGNAGK